MNCVLHPAANGHLALDLNDVSTDGWAQLSVYLENELGAIRFGRPSLGLRDRTHQSFRFSEFTLAAGWDSWVGNYLLAACHPGDEFLRRLFVRLRFGSKAAELSNAIAATGEVRQPGEFRARDIEMRRAPATER